MQYVKQPILLPTFRWIKSYFEEHPMESCESSPEMSRKEDPNVSSVTKEADQGYQVFEKPGSPSSHSHHTLDSGVQHDSATLDSNTSAYDGDDHNSYYSDRYVAIDLCEHACMSLQLDHWVVIDRLDSIASSAGSPCAATKSKEGRQGFDM